MKMLNMTSWTYVGYAAFPNIDNKQSLKEVLKETRLDIKEDKFEVTYFTFWTILHLNVYKILTRNEIDDPEQNVWNEINNWADVGKNPADGDVLSLIDETLLT